MPDNKEDRQAVINRILAKLALHIGRHKAVGMGELFEYAFLKPWANRINDTRKLRKVITDLRKDGVPICSSVNHNQYGYYLAVTASELEDYLSRIHVQALKKLSLEAKIRRVSLPELLGQMALNMGPEAHR